MSLCTRPGVAKLKLKNYCGYYKNKNMAHQTMPCIPEPIQNFGTGNSWIQTPRSFGPQKSPSQRCKPYSQEVSQQLLSSNMTLNIPTYPPATMAPIDIPKALLHSFTEPYVHYPFTSLHQLQSLTSCHRQGPSSSRCSDHLLEIHTNMIHWWHFGPHKILNN